MTNPITTTAALRSSFALPASLLPLNTHATNAEYDIKRSALRLLDDALRPMIDNAQSTMTDDRMIAMLDNMIDDFHDDPFHYLELDANADDDLPITDDMLRAAMNAEIDYYRAHPDELDDDETDFSDDNDDEILPLA